MTLSFTVTQVSLSSPGKVAAHLPATGGTDTHRPWPSIEPASSSRQQHRPEPEQRVVIAGAKWHLLLTIQLHRSSIIVRAVHSHVVVTLAPLVFLYST